MSDNLDFLILPQPGREGLRLYGVRPRPCLASSPALTGALFSPRVLGAAG